MSGDCLRWFKPLARSVATIISHLGKVWFLPTLIQRANVDPLEKQLYYAPWKDQIRLNSARGTFAAVYWPCMKSTARRARLLILMNWDDDEPTWKWYAPEAVTRTLSHFAVTGKVVRNRPSDEPVLNTFVFIYGADLKGYAETNNIEYSCLTRLLMSSSFFIHSSYQCVFFYFWDMGINVRVKARL